MPLVSVVSLWYFLESLEDDLLIRNAMKTKKETKCLATFGFFLNPNGLDCAVNFTGTQAAGANVYTFNRTFNNCSYLLNIRVPSTFGVSIGVADVVASEFSFTADFADRCHCFPPP